MFFDAAFGVCRIKKYIQNIYAMEKLARIQTNLRVLRAREEDNKKTSSATLMMDPMLSNVMGFHYLGDKDLPAYIKCRLNLDKNLKIGIINQSSEILPIPMAQ